MAKRVISYALTMAIVSWCVYFLFFTPSAMTEVESLIRKELPQGAGKQQVYDFLETRAIRSGAYNAGPDPFQGLPDKDRQWKRFVVAWVHRKSYVPLVPNHTIYIYFYFDLNQNLDEVKLQKIDDGPDS
jgi:hypothetical protein